MGYPPRPEMGYPPDLRWGTPYLRWGTPPTWDPLPITEQHSEHLLRGGQCASCVHAGGLSCSTLRLVTKAEQKLPTRNDVLNLFLNTSITKLSKVHVLNLGLMDMSQCTIGFSLFRWGEQNEFRKKRLTVLTWQLLVSLNLYRSKTFINPRSNDSRNDPSRKSEVVHETKFSLKISWQISG